VPEYGDIPLDIIDEVRSVCLGLPEAYEEFAWAGTRWRVRKHTFAHVVTVVSGWWPEHPVADWADGPTTVVSFRSAGQELDALAHAGYPFYKLHWGSNVVGMVLDESTDWAEVAELLTESYCVMAPKKLVQRVDRPGDDRDVDAVS
jgi:hypothetical protein